MAKIENIYEETLNPAGTTVTIDLDSPTYERYVFTGTGALAGAITITTSGTPLKGHTLEIQYNCTFSVGGATITILGVVLNGSLIGKSLLIKAYYNGSSWDTQLIPDFYETKVISNSHIVDATITGSKISSATVDPTNLNTTANTRILVLECSFEANEQCNNTVIIPVTGTMNKIDYEVIKALSNTDVGTIVPKINGSNVTLSSAISIPLSTTINTTGTTNCTAANTFTAGDTLTFVAAKTTAGGKVRLTIKYTQTA